MSTIDVSVAASSDDANQSGGGSVNLTNTSMDIEGFGNRHIGVRFLNVTIPSGATINTAYLTFVVISGQDDPNVSIRGELTNTPATYSTATNDITGRTYTTASATWNQANIGSGSKNTVDISSVVQEVIDLAGWASGDDMAFKLSYIDPSNVAVRTYDNSPAQAAILHVEYTEAEGGQTIPIDQVGEADEAQVIVVNKIKSISQANETDLIQSVLSLKVYSVSQINENNTIQSIESKKVYLVSQVSENDSIQSLDSHKFLDLNQVTELDEVLSFGTVIVVAIQQAQEINDIFSTSSNKIVSISSVDEIDSLLEFLSKKIKSIDQVGEIDIVNEMLFLANVMVGSIIISESDYKIILSETDYNIIMKEE